MRIVDAGPVSGKSCLVMGELDQTGSEAIKRGELNALNLKSTHPETSSPCGQAQQKKRHPRLSDTLDFIINGSSLTLV
jgi:hypothetical protein